LQAILDLERHPLDGLDSPSLQSLIADCQAGLSERGMFNLAGLVRPAAYRRPRCRARDRQ
jgi:hypothetical protein